MESRIKIRATVPEMKKFFDEDSGVRYQEIKDDRYTESDLNAMSEDKYNSTKFIWFVIYRHKQLKHHLSGTFTIKGLKKKIEDTEEVDYVS